MSNDIEFVDGLIIKAPHEKAPDFVKCSISIKRADLGNWLRGKDDEWINLQVKESKAGKWYAQVDNWKPSQEASGSQPDNFKDAPKQVDEFVPDDDIPF